MFGFSQWLRQFRSCKAATAKPARSYRRKSAPAGVPRVRLALEQLEARVAQASLQLVSQIDPSLVSDTADGTSYTAGYQPVSGALLPPAATVSQDGRYVVFVSSASNVVPGQVDVNSGNFNSGPNDVFLYDRMLNSIRLVSGVDGSTTTTGNGSADSPSISADGQFIAFRSSSNNLVSGQSGFAQSNVFVFDRVAGTTQLVSGVAGSATQTGNGASEAPAISADGTTIAFVSTSTNLVNGQTDSNGHFDVFVFARAAATTRLVSGVPSTVDGTVTTTTGNMGTVGPESPVISANGQFIAYFDNSTNLATGQMDTDNVEDLFVFDQGAGTNSLVTHADNSAAAQGANAFDGLSMSADGRYIVFVSNSPSLVGGEIDNGGPDVFVFDREAGTISLVSHMAGSATTTGDGLALDPAISADGTAIAFTSIADNLVSAQTDTNSSFDVFVFDQQTGAISLVSGVPSSVDGTVSTTTGNGNGFEIPSLSANGQFIAFYDDSTNLVSGQVNNNYHGQGTGADVFVYDQQTRTTRLVSGIDGSATMTGNDRADQSVAISADGGFIAFTSDSTNLISSQVDSNAAADVYEFNRAAGTTALVSQRDPGSPDLTPNGGSFFNDAISQDGRYVAFVSSATNLVPGQVDTNNNDDVFVYDRVTNTTRLVSGVDGSATTTGNGDAKDPVISADGQIIAFVSSSSNLVSGQSNNSFNNVFVFDLTTGAISLVSQAAGSTTATGNGDSDSPALSADGTTIAFVSSSTSLVSGQNDSNGGTDVFVRERGAGMIRLVSHMAGSATTTGDNQADSPSLSADGQFIAFASASTNLVSGQSDSNGESDVFVFDRVAGTTALVSGVAGAAATTGNNQADSPSISADGQFIAFASSSTNLVSGQNDGNFSADVFVFDRVAGTTRLVSGVNGSAATTGNGNSSSPAISSDGQFIAFVSSSTNLVSGQSDTNEGGDVFVFDLGGATTRLVSGSAGSMTAAGNESSNSPSMSADGRYVAFASASTNLVSGQSDTNEGGDVFVFDQVAGTTALVSGVAGAATTGNGDSESPALSADGQFLAFTSDSSNLVTGDYDRASDVFLSAENAGTASPSVQFNVASQTVDEAVGNVTLTATLSAAAAQDVSVPFTHGGTATAGVDYVLNTASPLVIPAGTLAATITLAVIDNSMAANDTTVVVTLGTPTNATLGTTSAATIDIHANVPSTFQVSNLADAGPGSLRAAIAQANANPGLDLIAFQKAGVIHLRSEIDITDDLVVNATARSGITIQGTKGVRLFAVAGSNGGSPLDVSLLKLTLSGGQATTSNGDDGGAILSIGADLTVSGCTFKSNSASNDGGAIAGLGGALQLQASLFKSNGAQTNGGGVFLGSGTAAALTQASFQGNQALDAAGGGLFDLSNDPVALANCVFKANQAFQGALTLGRNTDVTVTDSVLANNHTWLLDGVGGGVVGEDGAHLEMTRCTVSGNVGDRGAGGIEMGNGTLQLSDCAVTGNTAKRGLAGGLVLTGTTATVIQCTIAANSGAGGGIAAALGSSSEPTTLSVYNSTIAFNKGGGIVGTAATIALVSTIVADNTRNNTFSDLDNPDAAGNPGPAIAADHCLIRALAATAVVTGANNLMGVDPKLAKLALNGGTTRTIALKTSKHSASASPAIDAGSNPLQLDTDQRGTGFARANGVIDIGAFETQAS